MGDGEVILRATIDTKEFDAQMDYIESQMLDIEDKLKQADMGYEVGDTQKLEAQYERLGNQLLRLQTEQKKYNDSLNAMNNASLTNIERSMGNIGKSLNKITTRVVRWGLAIFGIRSAYLAVRQSMSTLSQYDKQMAVNLEYIRYVLANLIKPVVEVIIRLVYTLLSYLGYLAKAWFNIDLFSKSSAKNFEKQKKSLGGAAKSAKEINKQLAGFDEMNILQDNKNAGGGAGGDVTPNIDLKKLQGKVPAWIKWLGDNGDIVVSVLAGIAAGLIAVKLGFSALESLGIGIAVAGLVYTVQSLIDFIKKPTWNKFLKVLEGIATTVAGIAIAFGAWPVAIVAALALIVVEVIKHWDKIKEIFMGFINWLDDIFCGSLKSLFKLIWDIITTPFAVAIEFVKTLFGGLFNGIKSIIDGIKDIFKGDFVGGIKKILGGFGDILLAPFKALWSGAKKIIDKCIGIIKDFIGWVKDAIDWVQKLFKNTASNKLKEKVDKALKEQGITVKVKTSKNAKGGIVYPKVRYLASGGIINQPGRGVPLVGAIGGERGMEGIVPLTDSQQMALLGEAIGKYITINATITNTMNGRIISRELQKINNESDFAFNR